MKRMKSLKGSALTVLFCMAVLCTILCTACPNAAGGGGPVYVQVAYTELETYLANTASADKVNYIEVTGDILVADFEGKVVDGKVEAGELGKKIQAHPAKKVALKLPGKVEGLDSMSLCFAGCTNLVSLANIPSSVENMLYCFDGCTSLTKAPVIPANVTNINSCFAGCTSLTKAPDIPATVTNMALCFAGCTRLTKAPVIPESVTNMTYCFSGCSVLKGVKLLCNYNSTDDRFKDVFKDCTALEAGGIKVKNEHYDAYTAPAALDKMAVPGDDEAAKKAKFGTF